jgi:7-carboxy-7-deazaguanine synthase
MKIKIRSIPVHETFQQTVQGEGYWAGAVVDFIRLAGCPVGCPWCDTGYGDGGRSLPRIERDFTDLLAELQSPRVVISGGEPFIHHNLPDLMAAIAATGRQVSVETSGSFWQPIPDGVWMTLSPKEHLNPRYPVQPQIWQRANEVKLVISSGEELRFYQEALGQLQNIPVFLQPEWEERDRTLPLTLELLRQYPQYRLSVQLHKYIQVP